MLLLSWEEIASLEAWLVFTLNPVLGKDCKKILYAIFMADLQELSTSYRNSGFALIFKESRLENKVSVFTDSHPVNSDA